MIKKIIKLSALSALLFLINVAKADSFLLPSANKTNLAQSIKTESIIPLVYIKDLEYYNHTITKAYTGKITDWLSLEPEIIVTDNEELADYLLFPKLVTSKIEPINSEMSKYSMSVILELYAKGGNLLNTEQQNRYIIIETLQNPQQIAQKLLLKLLNEAVNNLMAKIRNNQIKLG